MCPDKELLSAFIDNEIEDRFSTIIKNHITACGKCRDVILTLESVQSLCRSDITGEKITESGKKVWSRIESSIANNLKTDFWNRKITVPYPVMAAAALLIFTISTILSFYLLTGKNYESRFNFSEAVTINKEEDFKLFERDQTLEVDLNLPENTVFMISGTPKLIREVDYLNTSK